MKRWRTKLLLAGGLAALAIPALGQDAPKSILPPGFGEAPPPAERPAPVPAAPPPASVPPAPDQPGLQDLDGLLESAAPDDLAALGAALPPKPIEIPDAARRPTDVVGVIGPDQWGLASDAFGGANGRFLSTLMRRLDAPLPSRWMSITLRRALLSRVPAPSHVNPVDWVAERAWLLLRMGEADAARMLVQSVDVDRFTPKMFQVAVQTALATADPAGLCPLVEGGRQTSDETVWGLSEAICAALGGDAGKASALLDQMRRSRGIGGIDLALTEKLIGAGTNSRRAANVQWEPVDSLTSWRFGLAAATGAEIPQRLIDGAGSRVRAWQARAPMLPVEQRFDAAEGAASLGVFSNASLVEMYSLVADTTDPSDIGDTVGGRLRAAYVGGDAASRVAAMRKLWDDGKSPTARYARLILTAAAAARVAPDAAFGDEAGDLIASMLSAGFDRQAARWSQAVAGISGKKGDRAWAMLALGAPRLAAPVARSRIESFASSDEDRHRTQMLVAGLAGLERINAGDRDRLADDFGLRLGERDRWTAMLDRAAAEGEQGSVVLLAAVGMQTGGWAGVPPNHLYHIVAALHRVGLDYQARMIAAEALARL